MILINGAPATTIPVTDRGLGYGDGVFRTLRARNGKPLHWERHHQKLAHDCAALQIPAPDAGQLLNEVCTVSKDHANAVVKIIVTRGSSERGYAPPRPSTPTRVVLGISFFPLPQTCAALAVQLCRLRLGHQPALAGIKHLNRLENVLARSEWQDAAIGEGLLLDQDDLAIGGTMSNLFIVEAGQLLTPLLDRCGVAGMTRERVMAVAAEAGIVCVEQRLPLHRVLEADEVFLVNSLMGLKAVARLGAREWTAMPVSRELCQRLDAEDAALA